MGQFVNGRATTGLAVLIAGAVTALNVTLIGLLLL
jgi:Mn2+/Fe2+ NRAMP family transporter